MIFNLSTPLSAHIHLYAALYQSVKRKKKKHQRQKLKARVAKKQHIEAAAVKRFSAVATSVHVLRSVIHLYQQTWCA